MAFEKSGLLTLLHAQVSICYQPELELPAIIFFSVHLLSTHQALLSPAEKSQRNQSQGDFLFFFKSPP